MGEHLRAESRTAAIGKERHCAFKRSFEVESSGLGKLNSGEARWMMVSFDQTGMIQEEEQVWE